MELLKQLYQIYSPSGQEKRMKRFIKWWIRNNIPGATISIDNVGNIYVTKGIAETYPCIVSHMDQVQRTHSKDFKPIEADGIIFGYSISNKRMEGLGADDKNGIWCCLKCLEKFDVIKAAFFVQEEVGCIGSFNANLDFFSNTRFVLQADRRGSSDLITAISSDLCSDEFLADIGMENYNYHPTHGLTTDVGTLKENGLYVSAVNISCGYYEPHTSHEFTIIKDLENCLNFIYHIIENCQKVYSHQDLGWDLGWDRDDPYAFDDEYFEATDIVEEYLMYQPGATADMFYETYKDIFPHLELKDYQNIINDYNNSIRKEQ